MRKVKTVTKRTYNAKVREAVKSRDDLWSEFEKFVEDNTKKLSSKRRDAFMDRLSSLIDKHVDLNNEISDWCHKNNVDISEFVCDVCNADIPTKREKTNPTKNNN